MAGRALATLMATGRHRLAWAFGLSIWSNACETPTAHARAPLSQRTCLCMQQFRRAAWNTDLPSASTSSGRRRGCVSGSAGVADSYATILTPTLIMAPRYFAGEVEFGEISQAGLQLALARHSSQAQAQA